MEKPKWKLAILVVLLTAALVYLLLGDKGLLHVRQLKIEQERLEKRVFELEQSKKELEEEIERLRNNSAAIEQMIRKEMGMIREDETLFIFPPEEQDEEP